MRRTIRERKKKGIAFLFLLLAIKKNLLYY